MRKIRKFLCKHFNMHKPTVLDTPFGDVYVYKCRYCGKFIRTDGKGKWVTFTYQYKEMI